MDESRTGDPPDGQSAWSIAPGILELDVTYKSLKPFLQKTQALFDNSEWMECAVCRQGLPSSGAATVVCPHTNCNTMSHLQCLSSRFVNHGAKGDHILPTSGTCPGCQSELVWSDLVRELSIRMRGLKGGGKDLRALLSETGDGISTLSTLDESASDDDDGFSVCDSDAPLEADCGASRLAKNSPKSTSKRGKARERPKTPDRVIPDSDSDWNHAAILT